jgi:hypothetical protein
VEVENLIAAFGEDTREPCGECVAEVVVDDYAHLSGATFKPSPPAISVTNSARPGTRRLTVATPASSLAHMRTLVTGSFLGSHLAEELPPESSSPSSRAGGRTY